MKAQDQDGWSREPTGGSWGGGHDQPQVSSALSGEEGGGVVGDRGGSYICFLSLMYVFMFLCQYM